MRITDQQLEGAIGQMLRTGVMLAALIVIIGGLIFLRQAGHSSSGDYAHFRPGSPERTSVTSIALSAMHGKGEGLVMFGLLVLIATPIVRVLVAGIGFLMEGDLLYAGVSTLVMLVLLYSIVFGH